MKTNSKGRDHSHSLNDDDVLNGCEPKIYEKPVLISYGDVRDITLGPTFGEGESGCALFYESGGSGGCGS